MLSYRFKDIDDVCDFLKTDDEHFPCICGLYNVVIDLAAKLVQAGYNIYSMDIAPYYCTGYNKEYYLFVTEDGISVEKAYNEYLNNYLKNECSLLLVHQDCSSKLITNNSWNYAIEFSLDWMDEDDFENDNDFIRLVKKTEPRIKDDRKGKPEFKKSEGENKKENKEYVGKNKDKPVRDDDCDKCVDCPWYDECEENGLSKFKLIKDDDKVKGVIASGDNDGYKWSKTYYNSEGITGDFIKDFAGF